MMDKINQAHRLPQSPLLSSSPSLKKWKGPANLAPEPGFEQSLAVAHIVPQALPVAQNQLLIQTDSPNLKSQNFQRSQMGAQIGIENPIQLGVQAQIKPQEQSPLRSQLQVGYPLAAGFVGPEMSVGSQKFSGQKTLTAMPPEGLEARMANNHMRAEPQNSVRLTGLDGLQEELPAGLTGLPEMTKGQTVSFLQNQGVWENSSHVPQTIQSDGKKLVFQNNLTGMQNLDQAGVVAEGGVQSDFGFSVFSEAPELELFSQRPTVQQQKTPNHSLPLHSTNTAFDLAGLNVEGIETQFSPYQRGETGTSQTRTHSGPRFEDALNGKDLLAANAKDARIELKNSPQMRNQMSGNDFIDVLKSTKAKSVDEVSAQASSALTGGEIPLSSANSAEPFLEALAVSRLLKKDAEDGNISPTIVESDRLQGGGLGNSLPSSIKLPMAEMTGHVVQGAMARERLTSETLLGLSQEMRSLLSHGGGEIRVRLKPENLGELQIQVITRGRNVGLKIKASDENSRQIIEESMKHLRESLASQNLSLARVDLSVKSPENDFQNAFQQQSYNPNQQSLMDGTSEQWSRRQSSWESDGESPTELKSSRNLSGLWNGNGGSTSSSRLDVIA